jgi:23S rRNA pseudouridine1911/1915/1917 synthase
MLRPCGDTIAIIRTMAQPTPNPAVAIDVLLEDPRFVIVAKPPGIVTEPGLGHLRDSLMNGAFARWGPALAKLGEGRDHGLLHRLDRDSSGAIVIAFDAGAYDAIRAQFEARTVRKRYLAIVQGKPPRGEGTIDVPLEEVRRGDMKVSIADRRGGVGKPAVTQWKTLDAGRGRSLLEVTIITGRLHQIRAHMAEIGCPVVGDRVYRVDLPPNTSALPRGRAAPALALHALGLGFAHPETGVAVDVTCPVPAQFAQIAADSGLTLPRAVR